MYRRILSFLKYFGAFFLLLVIGSCVSQEEISAPPVEEPASFSQSGENEVPDRWWTAFGNDELNTLVDTALASNFDIRTAWQRLQAAEAVVSRERGGLFPSLDGTAGAQTTRNQSDFGSSNDFSVGLSSSYEIDLWGRIGSQVDAEEYRAQASLADYQTAALTLSGQVVQTWARLAEAQQQLSLLDNQIATNRKVLRLLKNRFGTGQIRSVDILRQQQLLEATQQQKADAEANLKVLQHELSVLVGRPPQDTLDVQPNQLLDLAPLPETGVPVDLVQRRPDVRSAFNLVKAADRDLASAISNQYPRLTLSVSLNSSSNTAGGLFEEWVSSFAGNLLAPIFRGGELSAEVDRLEAVKKQRLYEYGQSVLTAFQEVEDALVREQKQRESINRIEEQVKLAEQAYSQLQLQYLNGTNNYLDVLTALDEVQQLRRDLLTAKLTLIEYRIGLYRALAGSLEIERKTGSDR
ncbi:efflux transporter outer membrane subunit [Fodinibius sp. Rm-B-1B1-1]|uniref:efflux transporter outer membrane subunit n=1 Tax=Fodinibius alkaliphilus TaxID=3140241 RepID=UPI003159D15B